LILFNSVDSEGGYRAYLEIWHKVCQRKESLS
jgi:hypothetical protein